MKTTLSINEIIEGWLANSDVAAVTKKSYQAKIRLWFRHLSMNKIDVRSPARRSVLNYKHTLESTGHSSLTVDGYITVVKLFYKYCEDSRYCENIAHGIRSSSKYKGHRKSALSSDQAYSLIHSIDGEMIIDKRDRLIICLMIYNGLRACEIMRMNVCDFDVLDGVSVIRLQRKGRHDKSDILSVTDNIIDLYQDYITSRECTPESPVFISHAYNHRDQRITVKSISEIVKRRLASIGINRADVTCHSLRHTCAALMIEQGVDIETIKDIFGHSSSSVTRIYADSAQQQKLIKETPAKYVERAILIAKNKSTDKE